MALGKRGGHVANLRDTTMLPLFCQTNSRQLRNEKKKSLCSKMSSQRRQSPIRQVKLMLGGVAEVPAVAAVCVSFSLSGITERARAPLIARYHPLTAPLHLAGVGPAGAPAALGEAESSARAVSRAAGWTDRTHTVQLQPPPLFPPLQTRCKT